MRRLHESLHIHSRLNGVESSRLDLEEAVFPVHPRYSEIMDPAGNVAKRLAIFEKAVVIVVYGEGFRSLAELVTQKSQEYQSYETEDCGSHV